MVKANRELVPLTNSPAVSGGNAFLFQAAARAIVIGRGIHGIDAQGGTLAGLDVEITHDTSVLVAAQRQVHLALINQARHLVDLVHRTTRGATAKQHRRGAPHDLQTVQAEGIALIKRRVAHAVHKHITRTLQSKASQANVFLATLCRQERDATRILQRLFHGVQIAVVNQFFCNDGNGLGNVTQLLRALANAGLGSPQRVFSLRRFGLFFHHHGWQRFACGWRRRGLRPAVDRCRQHHRTHGKQPVSRYIFNS